MRSANNAYTIRGSHSGAADDEGKTQPQIPKDLNPQRILISPWSTVYRVHFYSLSKITN